MKTAGIIAEYNPFHSGHRKMLEQVRANGAEAVAVIMSGCCVQRGEPALWDKYTRARAALSGGADLVLELPLPYAVSTAERFAFGGVSSLNALGVLDFLAFGSESGNLSLLQTAAEAASDCRVLDKIPSLMQSGIPYAAARQMAVEQEYPASVGSLFSSPNDLLGIEYIRQLALLGSRMEPMVIPRIGAGHDGAPTPEAASASWIRRQFLDGNLSAARPYLGEQAGLWEQAWLDGHCPLPELLERPMLCALRSKTPEQLSRLPDLSEGLENRLFRCIRQSCSVQELLSLLKTRRYPLSRLRRLILSAWLEIPAEICRQSPPYLRVLGATKAGLRLLSAAKASCTLPISSSPAVLARSSGRAAEWCALESRAEDLCAAVCRVPRPCGQHYLEKMILLP